MDHGCGITRYCLVVYRVIIFVNKNKTEECYETVELVTIFYILNYPDSFTVKAEQTEKCHDCPNTAYTSD